MEVFKAIQKIPKQKIININLMVFLSFLYKQGVDSSQIIFESRVSLNQANNVIEDIIFNEDEGKIKLILNLGLLTANSPVPEHIIDNFTVNTDSQAFQLINNLSSILLHKQLNLLLPEYSKSLKDVYLDGKSLFIENDSAFYSLASLNSHFTRILSDYEIILDTNWQNLPG